MTNKELLEAAAKAAGLQWECYHDREGLELYDGDLWNPLTDDGDALRLAMKLRMQVTEGLAYAIGAGWHGESEEARKNDPLAATRRAIVRTAAEIGRAMK